MKRILLLLLLASSALAGDIIATMSGVRVAIISPAVAFGCNHVVGPYTTVHLTRDGTNYGTGWVRFTNRQGVQQEEAASDFNVYSRTVINDRLAMAPYRAFPKEAVEPVAIPAVGDVVNVAALTKGGAIQKAKVLVVDPGNGYVLTDYPAIPGDSQSRVTTQSGVFVGFVSSAQQVGSTVIIPGVSTVASALPAPAVTNAPPPVVDPVAAAKAQGRAEALQQVRDLIGTLK